MEKKRGRLELINDILKTIMDNKNSIKMTPLLRKSNLSTERFKEYYRELEEKGLVREVITTSGENNGKTVSLTDKGFQFIEKYGTINNFIKEFGL